jgi:predicted transcriptional regulator
MAATSLKLPDELKRRIAELVEGSDRTAHSFMVEAIEQAAHCEELRLRFGDEKTGRAYDAGEVFRYLESARRVDACGDRVQRHGDGPVDCSDVFHCLPDAVANYNALTGH